MGWFLRPGQRQARFTGVLVLSGLLCACDVGQGVKKLGTIFGAGISPSSGADPFSITLAYRNPSSDGAIPERVVSIQGLRGIHSASFLSQCGATGSNCACFFFRSSADSAPTPASSIGVSGQNNSLSCTIPSSISDATLRANPNLFRYVMVKRADGSSINSGLIDLKTTLQIEDVLGPYLSRMKVRGIYSYACDRTFFEGEGVSASNIYCKAGQHLGVINANYNFYTYRSSTDYNSPGGDATFPSDICKRLNFLKIQCSGNTPVLQFGLYMTNADSFSVAITMTRAPVLVPPDTAPISAIYGYGALPDSAGNCPTGLVKVRPWVAQPASITPTGPTCPLDGCPSSFINSGNGLNNTVIGQSQPVNFEVMREANATPCDGTGSCLNASFSGASARESVTYLPQTPIICVIPPELLGGLF